MPPKKKNRSSGRKKDNTNASWEATRRVGEDRLPAQHPSSRSSLYSEYKKATEQFRKGLAEVLAPVTLGANVYDLVRAVDSLTASSDKNGTQQISPALLSTLRSAIRIRQRVSKTYESTGRVDAGHEYFVQVLKFCYQRLQPLVFSSRGEAAAHKHGADGEEETEFSNRFAALSVKEEAEVQEGERESTSDFTVDDEIERPVEPERDYRIQEDLIDGSDSFLACTFLDTMNTLMGEVSNAYDNLKLLCRQQSRGLTFELIKCATVVNAAVQELRYAEQMMVAERPYLDSIFRIIAAALYPDLNNLLVDEMEGDDALKRAAATSIMGDSMDLNSSLTDEQHEEWLRGVKRFAKQWNVDWNLVARPCRIVGALYLFSLGRIDQATVEKATGGTFVSKLDENGEFVAAELKPDLLLSRYDFLVGDRSLWVTIDFLERFKEGEGYGPKELGLTDRHLRDFTTASLCPCVISAVFSRFSDILAEGEVRGRSIPSEQLLMPLLAELRKFSEDSRAASRPTSFALVFIIYSIQTALISLKGDNDSFRLSTMAKLSFAKSIQGFYHSCEQPNFFVDGDLKERSREFLFTKALVPEEHELPGSIPGSSNVAFWNPCVAGMILLAHCSINLHQGHLFLTLYNQTRAVLHLSHALRERDVEIKSYELVVFLENLFGKAKTIWAVSPLPKRFEFAVHYWLSQGMKLDAAKKISRGSVCLLTKNSVNEGAFSMKYRREMKRIEDRVGSVADICHSYKVFDGSFAGSGSSGVEDWQAAFRRQVAEMLSSLDNDKALLSTNLLSFGLDLCDFHRTLLEKMSISQESTDGHVDTWEAEYTVGMLLSALDGEESVGGTGFVAEMIESFDEFFGDKSLSQYAFLV